MAGTTVDEDNVVYKTLQKSINEAGFEFSLEAVLELGAGKEKYQAIVDILSSVNNLPNLSEKADHIYKAFLKYLQTAYDQLEVKGQPAAELVFESLKAKGIKVVLNTGYNRQTAQLLLDKLHWNIGDQIDFLVTADDVERGRPHPDMIHQAMEEFRIESSDLIIKIGDSIIDIEEGKAAGCGVTVGITTGAHTRSQLGQANPDYIIDSLEAVLDLI